MEMRLAPILILYYFPAEFSRHLYDNAKKIFPSPQKNPSGVAATPRPRIILPPPRSITLASLPNRAHLPPSPSIVSPLEYASSVSRVDLVSPPPPPPQFSSPHHQSPKQMTRSRRRYPPRHRSSPRLSDIRIFLSMPAPSHTLPRISPCSSTTLDLRRSQISAQNVERSKIYEWRARHRERERGSFVQAKSLLRFLDSSRWTSASFSLLSSLRNLINRDSLLLDIGFRCPAFEIYERDRVRNQTRNFARPLAGDATSFPAKRFRRQ